jgi:hypothetical protein
MFQRLALIGCGLMGGSFALALKQAGAVAHVAGHGRSADTRQRALSLGAIDSAHADASSAVSGRHGASSWPTSWRGSSDATRSAWSGSCAVPAR